MTAVTAAPPPCLLQLCFCIGNQSANKVYAHPAIQKLCRDKCAACVAEANSPATCPSGTSPLPDACSKGLQFSPTVKALVDKCTQIYFADKTASLKRAQGC